MNYNNNETILFDNEGYYYYEENYQQQQEQQVEPQYAAAAYHYQPDYPPHTASNFTIEDYENELSYFTHYDQEMEEAVQEADNDDYGYNYGYNYGYDDSYEEMDETEDVESSQKPTIDHLMDDSLLKLIVDVQSYLVDASKDSPLLALQYKMYTYLKQRALEVGVDIPTTTA